MAIESTNFFSFLQQTRSPIGLVDQYNLSEIYTSDQDEALRNLLLNPEGLDQIFKLSQGDRRVIKEDIRLIGGLESPVIESLGLFDEVGPGISGDLSTYVRVGADVGEPGKQSFISPTQSDNIITFHGGLAAKNIEYSYLDIDGQAKTTAVSTSRESLFNTQANADGEYTSASFPGSTVRVRRRGHFNEIKLSKKLFVEKAGITESPGAIMRIPTYVRTTNTSDPAAAVLNAYATKNSPLEIPIRVSGSGNFTLGTATPQNEAYYFGYEIKRKRDNATVKTQVYSNASGAKPESIPVSFNLSGTIGNNVDCILLIYCSPSKIKELDLSGLGIQETAGKDLGLIGFDSLESLDLSNNGIKNIPTWLKVNYKTLKTLNLVGTAFWNNGPTEYFDHQNSISKSGSSGGGAPLRSAVQVLAYSGHQDSSNAGANAGTTQEIGNNGEYKNYDGTLATAIDGAGNAFINGRNADTNGSTSCVVDEANGFRVFGSLESINLGSAFKLRNADFSKVFPELLNVGLSRTMGANHVYGTPPKLNNNKNPAGISYNLSTQTNVSGSMRWIGDTPVYDTTDSAAIKDQFIGQFIMKTFTTRYNYGHSGGICTDNTMVGGKVSSAGLDGLNKYSFALTSAASAWSEWLSSTQTIDVYYSDIAVNLAHGNLTLEWKKLSTLNIGYTGTQGTRAKIKYNQTYNGTDAYIAGEEDAYDKLYANSLKSISAYQGGWAGRMFSIADQAKSLTTLNLGYIDWDGYEASDGSKYILPLNFVERGLANISDHAPLTTLNIRNIINGSSKELQFREDEFASMGNVTSLTCYTSYMWGVFPQFVNQTKSTSSVSLNMYNNRFYDLTNLGSNKNTRFSYLNAYNQGVSRGGAIIPNFDCDSNVNPRLYYCSFYNSLYATYGSSWNVSGKRNKKVFNALAGVPGVPTSSSSVDPVNWGDIAVERTGAGGTTFTSKNRAGTQGASRILYANTETNLLNYVRVGDDVYDVASGGSAIGKVCQVKNSSGSYVIITETVNYTNKTLYFQRAGVDASDYFNNHTALQSVYLYNCSLVGKVPRFEGNNGKIYYVNLNNNLLTTYVTGTLANITGQAIGRTNRPQLRQFYLKGNPISLTSIRDIIEDAYDMAKFYGSNLYTITIDLRNTKADIANGGLSNYSNEEIFYLGLPGDPAADPPIAAIPDPLLSKFNQLGSGNIYSRVNILLR